MAKFRVRLKLQGLELEIDGERGDMPAITSAVQHQLSSLIQPAEAIAEDRKQLQARNGEALNTDNIRNRTATNRRRKTKPSTEAPSAEPIEYRHNAAEYGNPQQSWTVLQKIVWLLAVIKGLADIKEVSYPQLTVTFNHHYKPTGVLHMHLVSRELAKAKVQNPPPVGEYNDLWYLTDEGERQAQQLMQGVLSLSS